jgi:prolyl-tRNA synthetase
MKNITKRSEDYSQWYLDIVEKAELAENSAVRGCMVIKPYGYSIWERYQLELDKMFKETGHVNAYFPLFIPKSFFSKEAKHIEGFAQESAIVTHYRLKKNPQTNEIEVDDTAKLEEELIVRPTSETIIYDTYSRWIKSYRDLPLLINQWANVVRWEMRTRPFLRTTEFLWQEGHTAHATLQEAEEEALKMLGVYQRFAEEFLAIPVIPGKKTDSERFAGALNTYTIEAMMQDGKALQSGTSHNLSDNFAKAFDVKFLNKENKFEYVHQTSWGLSTRMIGALIMTHSDDNGLILPPNIAPIQVVIIPIAKNEEDMEFVNKYVEDIIKKLESFRVKVDKRDFLSFGEKSFDWEKKGIPLRIEIGKRDIESNSVVVVRRDTLTKETVVIDNLTEYIQSILPKIQKDMFEKAKKNRLDNTYEVNSVEEMIDVVENKHGFGIGFWDMNKENEEMLKKEHKITIRCIPFEQDSLTGKSLISGVDTQTKVIFAKAY